jgi:hypothetical protein
VYAHSIGVLDWLRHPHRSAESRNEHSNELLPLAEVGEDAVPGAS